MKSHRRNQLIGLIGVTTLAVTVGIGLHFRQPRFAGQPLDHWVDQLCDGGASSELAESAVRSIGPSAVPFLLQRVRHEFWFYRKVWVTLPAELQQLFADPNWDAYSRSMLRVSRALDLLGPPALPHLVGALTDQDEQVQSFAIHRVAALSRDQEAAVSSLSRLLRHPNSRVRQQAAVALCDDVLPAQMQLSVPALIRALSDADVRSGAAWLLGQYGSDAQAALPKLTDLLKDPQPEIRQQASVALWRIRQATNALALWAGASAAPADPCSLLARLGEIGDAAKPVVPVILKCVNGPNGWRASGNIEAVKTAREALARIDPEALAQLEPQLNLGDEAPDAPRVRSMVSPELVTGENRGTR
jgi:HEAT repeat protein